MSRRSVLRLNFFLSSVLFLVGGLLAAAWLVSRYPWPVLHSDFSMAKESAFLGNWPLPALEEDRQERKKLRRFPKSEQQRRLGIIMRRMDYLNVPIFDFFLDQGVQYITPEMPAGASPSVPLIWPSLPSKRKIGSEDSSFRDVRYVVLPSPFGAQCVEGVHIVAGDELRITLPPAKTKRNIAFNVLPVAPSNLRAWLGQFSWARQFNDNEVNRIQAITIPVNDPAANVLRLSMGSGSLLLTSGVVAQWDKSGRLPVQVGTLSTVWRSAHEKVADETDDAQDAGVEEGEETSLGQIAQPTGVFAAPQSGVSNGTSASTQTSQMIGVVSGSASKPNEPVQTFLGQNAQNALKTAEADKIKKDGKDADKNVKAKASFPLDDLLDPESVKYNPVVSVSGPKSVALGYNALLIQLDPSLNHLFSDEAMFSALAPRLYAFLNHSINLNAQLPAVSPTELFQHTIVRQNGELIPVDLPILTKDLVAGSGVFNLYQEFRNFGYKVVSFAPPKALSMPDALSRGNEIPRVEGRWLDGNDWKFVARRRELDQQNEPVTGLEAIFKNEQSTSVQSMSENDFMKMSEMLEGLERASDAIPDWRANELAIINDRKQYLPRLIDSFQHWMKDNSQSRFFAHLYLNNDDLALRPSFKDFLKVLKYKKLKAIVLPSQAEELTRLVMLDRVFGQLIDSLIARRTHHRTVIGLLLPARTPEDKEGFARFVLSVPGLLSRKMPADKKLKFDDVLSTLAQTVGVQLSQFDVSGRRIFRGEGLEHEKQQVAAGVVNGILETGKGTDNKDNNDRRDKSVKQENNVNARASSESPKQKSSSGEASTSEKGQVAVESVSSTDSHPLLADSGSAQPPHVSRFRMIVLPRAAGCQPFEWTAASPYFGLTSSQPIVEEPFPRGRVIRVFPCGLRDQVIELSWFQTHSGGPQVEFSAQNVSQWLGGTFRMAAATKQGESSDAPLFLVGPQGLSLDSLPLRLQKFSSKEVLLLFDMSNRNQVGRDTLARILNLNSQIQNPQMSARTLVYFFREPIRR